MDDSLFRSSDTGKTWVKIWTTGGTRIQSIIEQNGSIFLSVADIYGSTQYSGIYKSIDDGLTWTKKTSSTDFSYVRTLLAAGPQNVAAVTKSNGIWISSDLGSTWNKAAIHTSETPILWTGRFYSGSGFAAGENKTFLTSTDQGMTWDSSACNGILDYDAIFDIQPISSQRIIAIRYYSDTVYQTTNKGKSWDVLLSKNLPTDAYGTSSKTSLSLIGSKLYCQSEIGIFEADIPTLNWEYKGTGILNANIKSLASNNGTLYASSLSGVFRSTDNGITWIYPEDSSQLRWRSIGQLHSASDGIYTIGEEGVWRHNGSLWEMIDSSFTYDISSSGDTVVWAAGSTGLLYTTDRGIHLRSGNGSGLNQLLQGDTTAAFNIFSTGSAFIAQVGFLTYDPSVGGSYYIPRLYRSGDGMQSWYMVDSVTVGDYLIFVKYGNDIFAGSSNGYGLSKSTDDGVTWRHVSSISSNAYIDAIAAISGSIFLSIAGDSLLADGIYHSTDGGTRWTFIGEGVHPALCIISFNDYLYAGIANEGVWRRPLAQIGVRQNDKIPTDDFAIYPNPSNGITKIYYTLPLSSVVTIEIFNPLGERLRSFTYGKENVGSHEHEFDISSLPSGSYYFRIQLDGKSFIRLCELVK